MALGEFPSQSPGLGPSVCARFGRSDPLAAPCPGGSPARGAASEAGSWGAELGLTEWADSGARSSTSDPLSQGNQEQASPCWKFGHRRFQVK